jgi:rhodanese-related sulfurtransferase
MATFRDLLNQTKAQIREVDTAQAEELRAAPGAVVLDVREPDEYEQGAIPGSIHIPRGQLESNIEGRVPDHDTPLVVCAGGCRCRVAETLEELATATSPGQQLQPWKEGRDWARVLRPDQRNRYQRHLLLPEVGEEDQPSCRRQAHLLAPAGSAHRPATWPPPAWAPSASSTWPSSTSPTCSARSPQHGSHQ